MDEQPGTLRLDGSLTLPGLPRLWPRVLRAAEAARGRPWVLDVSAATACDTAGAAMLAQALARHGGATLHGASAAVGALVDQAGAVSSPAPARRGGWGVAGWGRGLTTRLLGTVEFLGESLRALVLVPRRRRQFRLSDLVRLADEAGVRAVPLVLLLGFLMGLILAFQSSVPLRRFGADLFVVNLVSLSLLRELGPLLSAVILSGRTGSAFAAELGTMKVNEELAALEVMGVSTVTMLVLPRLAAAVLVMPALTVLLELAGLAGMLVVMLAFGFPPTTVATQMLRAVRLRDLWGGLFKAVVFGAVVAGIGCRAGMATGSGARAVGLSTTGAVVGGIVATILLDGLFAILFYRLGV